MDISPWHDGKASSVESDELTRLDGTHDTPTEQPVPEQDKADVDWPPKTLLAWNSVPSDPGDTSSSLAGHARSLWTPLEAFFLLKGYRLFVYESPEYDVPADRNEIRAEDPYHVFIWKRVPSRFYCPRNKLCGATRLSDGTHVVLQLLAIGEDGQEEVRIQKRLHEDPISTTYRNRAVPLLEMITHDEEKMVFGVFPLVCAAHGCPQQCSPSEALKLCYAWMECLVYLHDNLVAHMDIGSQEFLVNYGGPLDDPWILDTKGHYGPFYEYFEPQWWITDFGESVLFEPNSDPTARKVVGLCAGKLTYPIAHYPKMLGPEVWRPENQGQPYCPFKHDIYQLGQTLRVYLRGLAETCPRLDEILLSMTREDPSLRATMAEVMIAMDRFLVALTKGEYQLPDKSGLEELADCCQAACNL